MVKYPMEKYEYYGLTVSLILIFVHDSIFFVIAIIEIRQYIFIDNSIRVLHRFTTRYFTILTPFCLCTIYAHATLVIVRCY